MRFLFLLITTCVLLEYGSTSYSTGGGGDSSGWQGISSHGAVTSYGHPVVNHIPDSYGNSNQDLGSSHNSYGSYGVQESYGGGGSDLHAELDQGFHGEHVQHHYTHAVPVSEHVEVTKPIAIPVVKNIGVPVPAPVAIPVPHPIAIGIPQPYPVHVPVSKPIAIPVVKTIAIPIEKKVPYAIEKIIPVPVEKAIPIPVEKHIPVPVEKPYPIHIPVYKHIFHRAKSYSSHGHHSHGHHSHGPHSYGGMGHHGWNS